MAPSSGSAEDSLRLYRAKRDFSKTREPVGRSAGTAANARTAGPDGQSSSGRFVVQRHRARRLHYDFRLEIGGVLVSWAVPKGPSLDPSVRRAAFRVEDHPLGYLDFEGVIPPGQYGAGDVIVWDAARWSPHGTRGPGTAVSAGELHMDLRGQKLRGRMVLVRLETRSSRREEWLMVHEDDQEAVKGWNIEGHPRSVAPVFLRWSWRLAGAPG